MALAVFVDLEDYHTLFGGQYDVVWLPKNRSTIGEDFFVRDGTGIK